MTEQLTIDTLGPDVRTRGILACVAGDIVHARDREAICTAIVETAEANNDLVSNNELRRRIPGWVNPNVVGAVLAGLTRKGVLVVVAQNISDDTRSGNGGKFQPVRRLTDATGVK